MPTTSFSVTAPAVSPEQAWRYLRDYANVPEWAATTLGAEPLEGSDALWVVRLVRWPADEMTCSRSPDDDAPWTGAPRTVRFDMHNDTGAVRSTEEFHISAGEQGCVVTYTMRLGMSGWRSRLPCMGAALWVYLRADSASTRVALERRLQEGRHTDTISV